MLHADVYGCICFGIKCAFNVLFFVDWVLIPYLLRGQSKSECELQWNDVMGKYKQYDAIVDIRIGLQTIHSYYRRTHMY